jgi:hypothetical protein
LLNGADLVGADLASAQLVGANLANADLRGANLRGATLRTARLRRAVLEGANLEEADLVSAVLDQAKLRRARLARAQLQMANLRNADLTEAVLTAAQLDASFLQGMKLIGANLENATLRGADLRDADLTDVNLTGARYSRDTRWPDGFDPQEIGGSFQGHPPTVGMCERGMSVPQSETYSLEEIDRVEEQYRLPQGQPSLGEALKMLIHRWKAGARDERTLIRLLFLLWYSLCEPLHLTGLPVELTEPNFEEVFESAGGEAGAPPLILWTVAQMAHSHPYAVGDEARWESAAGRLFERALQLKPELTAEDFAGMGAAGDYFRHIFGLG